jgi:hypothetical protein
MVQQNPTSGRPKVNVDFEIEDVPASSYSQTSFETSSLPTLHNQFQHLPTPLQAPHIPTVCSDKPTAFATRMPPTGFPSLVSFEPPVLQANGSTHLLGLISCHDGTSFDQNDLHFQAQSNPLMASPSHRLLQSSQSSTRKRAPKAPTMSAEKWKPSESRIKQLYVYKDKSVKELREIVNEEFGLKAK